MMSSEYKGAIGEGKFIIQHFITDKILYRPEHGARSAAGLAVGLKLGAGV